MNDEMQSPTLMNKNVNDLTVGDALKINLVVLAVMVAIPSALVAVGVVSEKVGAWKQARKNKKFEQEFAVK